MKNLPFSEWGLEDDEDVDDLHHLDPRRPKEGMDTTKLNGRDHLTTWSQTKKGQQVGLYVTPVPGLSQVMLEYGLWSNHFTTIYEESHTVVTENKG